MWIFRAVFVEWVYGTLSQHIRNRLADRLAPFLKESKKGLDIGSSSGRLDSIIEKKVNVQITGVDIYLPENPLIEVILFDGKKLPFRDDSFDFVMLVDTIHHIKHQEKILREARRVTKKFVLIKDHYFENGFDLFMLKLFDFLFNAPFGIHLEYSFLNTAQWNRLFSRVGLKLASEEKYRYGLDPLKQVIFLLEK